MTILMTARYRVQPQSVEVCKRAVVDLIDHVKNREPRTKLYLALQEIVNPMSFVHILGFENEAALNLHQNSQASDQFASIVYPQTVAPMEFSEYKLVGSTLPDL